MATLFRSQFEARLINRRGNWMANVGMDATTQNGTNASLNDPLTDAAAFAGLALANPMSLADADLASVDVSLIPVISDVADYLLLLGIAGQFADVTERTGQGGQNLSDFAARVAKEASERGEYIRRVYGYGLPTQPVVLGQPVDIFPDPRRNDWGLGCGRVDH